MHSIIYLLQDGDDVGTSIFKIGRSSKIENMRSIPRLKSYNDGTIVYNTWWVPNRLVNVIEQKIVSVFEKKYTKHRGREWFRGDVLSMRNRIHKIINKMMDLSETDSEESEVDNKIHADSKRVHVDTIGSNARLLNDSHSHKLELATAISDASIDSNSHKAEKNIVLLPTDDSFVKKEDIHDISQHVTSNESQCQKTDHQPIMECVKIENKSQICTITYLLEHLIEKEYYNPKWTLDEFRHFIQKESITTSNKIVELCRTERVADITIKNIEYNSICITSSLDIDNSDRKLKLNFNANVKEMGEFIHVQCNVYIIPPSLVSGVDSTMINTTFVEKIQSYIEVQSYKITPCTIFHNTTHLQHYDSLALIHKNYIYEDIERRLGMFKKKWYSKQLRSTIPYIIQFHKKGFIMINREYWMLNSNFSRSSGSNNGGCGWIPPLLENNPDLENYQIRLYTDTTKPNCSEHIKIYLAKLKEILIALPHDYSEFTPEIDDSTLNWYLFECNMNKYEEANDDRYIIKEEAYQDYVNSCHDNMIHRIMEEPQFYQEFEGFYCRNEHVHKEKRWIKRVMKDTYSGIQRITNKS